MEQQTRIANVIDSVGSNASYDNAVKSLLANKSILAWILKCCVTEFKPFSLATIVECIKGTPEVSTKAVHRNEADVDALNGNEEVVGDNSEDSSVSETKITYDLRFTAVVPDTEQPIELIINVEAQKNKVSYDIEKRVIYYMSRLISGQYGTVFTHSEYGKIQKVYSIWFCVTTADYMKNTISGISLKPDVVYGNPKLKPNSVDLMRGVIVNLGDVNEAEDNDILKLMNTLLSSTISADEKKRVMQDDFKIAMTEELESEVAEVCNLSQSVLEQGKIEGKLEEKIETAKNLHEMGMDISFIARALKVTSDVVGTWLGIQKA